MADYAITMPDEDSLIVEAIAGHRLLPPGVLLAHIVHSWVSEQIRIAEAVSAGVPLRAPREKDYEKAVASDLAARGFSVRTQVRTQKGTADMVVNDLVVVEFKASIDSWGDLHGAAGQAKAYAAELGMPHAIVCAPRLDAKFVGHAVDISGIADFCHDATVGDKGSKVTQLRALDISTAAIARK